MFSTFEPGPVNIKVYTRNDTGTNWSTTPIYDQDISPGQPRTWKIEKERTEEFFRYALTSRAADAHTRDLYMMKAMLAGYKLMIMV